MEKKNNMGLVIVAVWSVVVRIGAKKIYWEITNEREATTMPEIKIEK